MEAKDALYAAVGAPIAAAKALNQRFETLRTDMENRTEDLTTSAQDLLEQWAKEGRQAVTKVSDGKMVDEIASKVDFDQAREQVIKLRDQLEDMLATWRASFKPVEEAAGKAARNAAEAVADAGDAVEKATEKVEKTVRAKTTRPAAKQPATNAAAKPAAKKPAAKKPAAKSTAAKTTAAKTTTTKTTTPKTTTKAS